MKSTFINAETGRYAVFGGALLGGGGGGYTEEGLRILDMALEFRDEIPLVDIGGIDPEVIILTASLVGSPASENRYVAPQHYRRVYQLFRQGYDGEIGGIITNETGGQSSTNGWMLAAMTGLPLIDAPCNGRAHPTGVMGSLGLAQETGYRSVQAAVGGYAAVETEMIVTGTLEGTSALVRAAATAAGGFVTVLRNPVTAAYVTQHGAVGAMARSIEIGQAICQNLGNGAMVVEALRQTAHLEVLGHGVIGEASLTITDGFDLGTLTVGCGDSDIELLFWNEFMTAEIDGRRLATFPDLIAILDSESGLPVTSAAARKGQRVYVVYIPRCKLLLGSSMFNRVLLQDAENRIGKELVRYVF